MGLVSARWLITPKLSVESATDSIAFWVRSYYSFVAGDDSLFVLVSTTDSLPASFTDILGAYDVGSGGDFINVYVRFAHSLAAYNGMDIFVAFLHTDPDDGDNTVYLDDVTGPELLEAPQPPSVPQPDDGAVAIGADTVLHWTNGAGTDSIDLYLAMSSDSVDGLYPEARKVYNQLVTSYDPPGNLASNQIYYWRVVTKNQYGSTNGDVWNFTVIGTSLAGSYDIGGGNNDYASFSEAVSAMSSNGISAAVTFNVYGTVYDEEVIIGDITGTSAVNTITFVDYPDANDAELNFTGTATEYGVVTLLGADYVTFDGIDINISGALDADRCIHLGDINVSCQHNRFKNATMVGNGTVSSISYAIGSLGANNDDNIFSNLAVSNARQAFHLTSYTTAGQQSAGNIIENCTTTNVWMAVYASYQESFHIRDNDFQLNSNANTSTYGIHLDTQLSGDTVYVYRNEVHNIVSTSGGYNAFVRLDPTGGVALVYNNFFYDFSLSGSAGTRAVYLEAGTIGFYFNSVRVNDIDATGATNTIYCGTSTGRYYDIKNNILYNEEATNAAYNVYALLGSYSPDVLDYNAYYGSGTGYHLADVLDVVYDDLASMQAGTDYEDYGVEGNPGFTSATDLHILNTQGLVSNGGTVITGISDDFDEEARSGTPDIGADEYLYLAPAKDYAILEIVGVQALYPELTPVTLPVRVQNRGSEAQTDVPVRLFYNAGQIGGDSLVSLNPEEVDTVYFSWTTPAAPDAGTLEAQCYLTDDIDTSNDSVTADVTIVGTPMSGSYDIGGGANDYADFGSAIIDLGLRTIDGAVVFNVYAGTYNEQVSIGAIDGASAVNTITFQAAGALDDPPLISSASSPGVKIDGGDYITFDGIDITITLNGQVFLITNDADYNTLKNCAVTGNDVTSSSGYGVYINGGGNDYNLIDNVTVSGAYYSIRLYGSSSNNDLFNEVRNCTIAEGRYCVYLYYQESCKFHDNDIQPGWSGNSGTTYGLYMYSHSSGDTSYFYNNEMHNFRNASTSYGIYCSSSSGLLYAYNNFVNDFQVTGTSVLYATYVAGGYAEFYFNSIHIGDVGTTGNIRGLYQSSGTCTFENNIVQVNVPTEECWGLYRSSGTLTSDYNCFYGTGTGYNMGYDALDYATLADWQTGTGYDLNSVEGEPGYISGTNLHIQPTFGTVESRGVTIGGIATDIDGDTREANPDIGADEYEFEAMPHDYGILGFVDFLTQYDANTPYVIKAEVKNWGTNAETDVPVVLYYEGVSKDTVYMSLAADEIDTAELDWTTPNVAFEEGDLEVQAFCPADGFDGNDSLISTVIIVGPPLSGTYDLGGGNMDFANFTEAANALNLSGIDGPVTFDCYAGTYTENITINEVTGASFTDRITFQSHASDVVTLTASGGTQVVYLDGADYITFDDIDISGSGSVYYCVEIDNDADFITLQNLTLTGSDSTNTSVYAVKQHMDGNDNTTLDNLIITNACYGFRNYTGSGYNTNTEVKNCFISGANYGVYFDNNSGTGSSFSIHDNEIQPHGNGAISAYGIYISSLSGGDTVYVYNNDIHNIRYEGTSTSTGLAGIYIYGAGNQVQYIYNNFIYGFSATGGTPDINGIRLGYGMNYAYHNSIHIGDGNVFDAFAGIYATGDTFVVVDNIISVEEADGACWGIYYYTRDSIYSEYNCFYGPGTGYNIGRDLSADYQTLAAWQGAGFDVNSIEGDPGFISASDLHISPFATLVDGAGTYLTDVPTDYDGDMRLDPPDIGADEYEPAGPPEAVDDLVIVPDTPNNDIILYWSAAVDANSYKIYIADVPFWDPADGVYLDATGDVTYTHQDVLPAAGIKFYLVVSSSDAPPAPPAPQIGDRRND
ncbi:right-handed parallel beta-helix repeat-containing protein [bacterium]|nr:right-handed parallel beta-helix repeat-containing protein [bacterium]